MIRNFTNGESISWNPDQGGGVLTDRAGTKIAVTVIGEARGGVVFKDGRGQGFLKAGERTIALNGPTAGWTAPKYLGSRGQTIRAGAIPHATPGTSLRQGFLNRGSLRAIAKEYIPGPNGAVFKEANTPAPPENNAQLWALTGHSTVPTDPAVPVVLVDDKVPYGYRLRLTSFLTQLAPAVTYDDNYIWRLTVGGFDLWNPFSPVLRTGRPNSSNAPALISPQLEDLPVFGPGTPIKVTISARYPLAATDQAKVVLFGTLWGDK